MEPRSSEPVFVRVNDVNEAADVVAVGHARQIFVRLQLQPSTQSGLAGRLIPIRKFANRFDN